MAGLPENLTLRQRLDQQATRRTPPRPTRTSLIDETPQTPLQPPRLQGESESTTNPPRREMPPPPEPPDNIFEEFLSGVRASKEQSYAANAAREARRAEKAGNQERREAFMNKAYGHLYRADQLGPSVKSYKDVDHLGDAVRYALGLTGQSALSVTASIMGGAAGRIATPVLRSATGLNRLNKIRRFGTQIDNAGAFAGASGAMYGDIRGGTILAQETDPNIRDQPVGVKERASLLTTAGSTALEAAVPAAIGARVGRRTLARNTGIAGEVTGRVSGKGRLMSDMFAEGMTELSQENLEQFALHLQNPEQARFASTEQGINAFFGGLAGGAFGHGVGRTFEGAVDLASRVKPQGVNGTLGMFGNMKLDPKAEALATVLRKNDVTRPAQKIIDQINQKLFKSGLNNKNFLPQLEQLIQERSSGPVRDQIIAITKMFVGLKDFGSSSYQQGRSQLINALKKQGVKKPGKIVEGIELQLEQQESNISNGINNALYEDTAQNNVDKALESLGQIPDAYGGEPIAGYDNLRLIDTSDPAVGKDINIDDYHFIANAPERGRLTERHSPIGKPESQGIKLPAYLPNAQTSQEVRDIFEEFDVAGVEALMDEKIGDNFQLRNLIQYMKQSPYTSTLADPFSDPDPETNPLQTDFDTERGVLTTFSTYLDAANKTYQTTEQNNYIQAARAIIDELTNRNKSNTDQQIEVIEQHNRQIQELQEALELETDTSGKVAEKGYYRDDGTYVPSLKQLFKDKYVIGAVKRQEVSDEIAPGLRATQDDMREFQRGINQTTSEEDEDRMLKQRIPFLQRVPWAERQLSDGEPYRIVWVDPESVAIQTQRNWRLRQDNKSEETPKDHQWISEGLSSIMNMPETIGVLKTDEDNNPVIGDPAIKGEVALDNNETAVGKVLLKSGETPQYGSVITTNKLPSKPISRNFRRFKGFYSGDTESSQTHWREQYEELKKDPVSKELVDAELINDLLDLAEVSGIKEFFDIALKAQREKPENFSAWLNQRMHDATKNIFERLQDAADEDLTFLRNPEIGSIKELRKIFEGHLHTETGIIIGVEDSQLIPLLDQLEAAQTKISESLIHLKSEKAGIEESGKQGPIPTGMDKRIINIRTRELQKLIKTISEIRRRLDQRLYAENQENFTYIGKANDESIEGTGATVYDPEKLPQQSAKSEIDLETGEGFLPELPQIPEAPGIKAVTVRGLENAVNKANQLAQAIGARTLGKAVNELEGFLSRHAYAFITDQKGARGVNINRLDGMNPSHAVLVMLNSLKNPRTLKQLETAAATQGAIVLAQRSKINRKAFEKHMADLAYAPHPGNPSLYITTQPLQLFRNNETMAAEVEQYRKNVAEYNEALEKRQEIEVKSEFISRLLWRMNVWYNGPARVNKKGQHSYNWSEADRIQLEKYGYQITRNGIGKIVLRPITKKEDTDTKDKKTTETAQPRTAESRKKAKRSREDREEKLEETLASNFRMAEAELQQAMEVISDWTSSDARAALVNFFNNRGYTDSERRMMRDLNKSVLRNPRVHQQIVEALQVGKDAEELVEALKLTKEELASVLKREDEGLYYAAAFQLATLNKLKLSPTPEQWFKRIIEYLAGLLNIHMAHFFGESVFTAIRTGNLTNKDDIKQVYKDISGELDQSLENIANVTRRAINRLVTSAPDVLRQYGTVGRELADLFAVPESSDKFSKSPGFIPRRRRQNDAWLNKLKRSVLDKFSASELEEGWKAYRLGATHASDAALAIDIYVNQVYAYMQRSGVMLTNFKNKKFTTQAAIERTFRVPMAFNVKAVTDNRLELQQLFVKHGLDPDQSRNVVDSILWAGGHFSLVENEFDQDQNPTSTGTLSSLLQVINIGNVAEFTKYMTNDGDAALLKFTRQAVHKAEFTKSFGHNGKKITQALNTLKAGGLGRSELKYVEDRVIPSMIGTLAYKMHPKWRELIGTAITIQNMAILPLMIFPAMVDMWGISLVTGDMSDGWKAFKSGMREIRRSFVNEPDANTQLAELLGIITDHSLLDRVGDTYNEMMDTSLLRKLNKKFFFATGIEQWTKGIRIAAMHAAIQYLVQHQNNEEKLNALGLTVGQVKIDSDGNLTGLGTSEPIAQAINRFVDSAVLRPSAAHRPAWGSDPRWLLVWHLKQFTFTFHKVFLSRVIQQMKNPDNQTKTKMMILLPFLMMVPTMMASDMIKNIVAPSVYYDNMSFTELVQHAISRSSVAGIGTFGLDAMRDVEFGKIPGSSLLGPTADSAYRFYDKGFAEGLFRLTPGYALWNRWLR